MGKIIVNWKAMLRMVICVGVIFNFQFSIFNSARSQAPGTTPVEVSSETQMLHGRKYYVHIVKTGQTVYSISKAYKVESYDAVTHVDIHFLHSGDTVWLPARGQFSEAAKKNEASEGTPDTPTAPASQAAPSSQGAPSTSDHKTTTASSSTSSPLKAVVPKVRKTGKTLKVALMMPLHLNQIDEVSTSKFDIEQRGKKSYRQFEFIEFYEGIRMALDILATEGVSVELNVVDVNDNNAAKVEEAFVSNNVAQSDVLIALLLRDAFDKAAELAKEANLYIVNPMATRSELCADNPYMVKMQPSVAGQVAIVLANMKKERPAGHLYIVHSNTKAERPVLDEIKRQLDERGDIKYTIFNWSQAAKLTNVLKATPECSVLSIYDQGKDPNRVFVGNLLNRLSAIKQGTPVLYTLVDWTKEYTDVDFAQLQALNYHTFATSWNMTDEVHVDFLRTFRENYGAEPTSPLAAMGYDLTLYIVDGLHRRGSAFWTSPSASGLGLTQPILLERSGAGLENSRAALYRMVDLKLIRN